MRDLTTRHKAPVICAGDIFDDGWRPHRCPPELINFAIEHLRMPFGFYAIPGQHDLPHHNYDDLEKSAYWTLMESGTLTNLNPLELRAVSDELVISAFPWGVDPEPWGQDNGGLVHLAVVHKFIWTRGSGYEGAPDNARVSEYDKALRGYDAAVFGDNHKGFLFNQRHPCPILNCGTFIRRKADEFGYQPAVGLLNTDGSIVRYPLDTSKDKWNAFSQIVEERALENFDMTGLMTDLSSMADAGINFREAVNHYINKNNVPLPVRKHILGALEVK